MKPAMGAANPADTARAAVHGTTHSITRRLSVMFAVTSLLVFTLIGTGVFVTMKEQLFAELRATLDTRAKVAHLIVSHPYGTDRWHIAQEKLTVLEPPDNSTLYYVQSADPAFSFGTLPQWTPERTIDHAFQVMRSASGDDLIAHTEMIPPNGPRPALKVIVASSCQRTHGLLMRLGATLAALIACATLISLLLSRAVARFGLAPLNRLSTEAAMLSPANRGQRLQTGALPSELHELTVSFNSALERIQQAYEQLESFNADVAHELRTPVSILIGQTEVALNSREQSQERLRQTLLSNLEELERLRVIVNDMLFLSRSDRGERATELVEVSLATEAARLLDFFEMLFEEAQLHVSLEGDARAWVDPSLFGRALSNLLTNAIHHSQAGDTVHVRIVPHPGEVEIAVSNPGEPIGMEARALIFERFYRLEEARANSGENHGLGLSIVRAVARMHGGQTQVSSARGMNIFSFSVATARNAADTDAAPAQRAHAELPPRQPALRTD